MREFQTAGPLTPKALADNANDVCGTVSRQGPQKKISVDYCSTFCTGQMSFLSPNQQWHVDAMNNNNYYYYDYNPQK